MRMSSFLVNRAARHRLGWALALSSLLHFSFLIGTSWHVPSGAMNRLRQTDARLHVHLSPPPREEKTFSPPLPAIQPARESTSRVIPPRFIVEPDLSVFQDIPLSAGGKVRFRLHVSSIGTINGVEVLGHDPLPPELLGGLKNLLSKTMLRPAEQDGQAVGSTLDITVGFEPIDVDTP